MSCVLATIDEGYAPFAGTYVDQVLDFAQEFSRRYGPDPEPGSVANDEISNSFEPGSKGPWPEAETRRPYDIAGGLCILGISHFVRSLRLLLVSDMALYGFQSVTRSIVESAASAAWVLDRGIDRRERVVRSLLLEIREHHRVQEGREGRRG